MHSAENSIIQNAAAARMGLVGHTEVDGDGMSILGADVGLKITSEHERRLLAYARRLRTVGIDEGTMPLGRYRYRIRVDGLGFNVLSQWDVIDNVELRTEQP